MAWDDPDHLTHQQRQLAGYMSTLSEEAFFAGWHTGLEFALWGLRLDQRLGNITITAEHMANLAMLSDAAGGWIVWGDDDERERFVPRDEWLVLYAGHQATGTPAPADPWTRPPPDVAVGLIDLMKLAFAWRAQGALSRWHTGPSVALAKGVDAFGKQYPTFVAGHLPDDTVVGLDQQAADATTGAEQWRTTLESALTTARRRNIEARDLIRVLSQHVSDDNTRERIRAWMEGNPFLGTPGPAVFPAPSTEAEPTNLAGDSSMATIMAGLLQRWWLAEPDDRGQVRALRTSTRLVLERLQRDGRGQVSAAPMTAAEQTDLLLAQYLEAHPQAQPSAVTALDLIAWAKAGDGRG